MHAPFLCRVFEFHHKQIIVGIRQITDGDKLLVICFRIVIGNFGLIVDNRLAVLLNRFMHNASIMWLVVGYLRGGDSLVRLPYLTPSGGKTCIS